MLMGCYGDEGCYGDNGRLIIERIDCLFDSFTGSQCHLGIKDYITCCIHLKPLFIQTDSMN